MTTYNCPRCEQPAKLDEEDVPRCANPDCPFYMTIVDQFRH